MDFSSISCIIVQKSGKDNASQEYVILNEIKNL